MNRHDERQLVHYVAAHDKALMHHDEREAARIRRVVLARLNLHLTRESPAGTARVFTT